ncbi:CB068 protein, partial [Anthoscopus minutus]|nr:CB068 protein [Anthoscopus minutus]
PGWRCRPGGRLDMSHGFVRHIRRNQLARDAYDRAVRQARGRARTRLTPAPARPRRPDQQVYRPHRGSGALWGGGRYRWVLWGSRSAVGDGSVGHREPQQAQRVTWVLQGDSAEEVTRRVCAQSPLEPPLRRALCQRVQDELSKRR